MSINVVNTSYLISTSKHICTEWKPIGISNTWADIAISGTGQYQTIIAKNGPIYISNDYGSTWTIINIVYNWSSVAMSFDGSKQVASIYGGIVFSSNNYGISWKKEDIPIGNWVSITMSRDGLTIYVCPSEGYIHYINTNLSYWSKLFTIEPNNWSKVVLSPDTKWQFAVTTNNLTYYSFTYSKDWIQQYLFQLNYFLI